MTREREVREEARVLAEQVQPVVLGRVELLERDAIGHDVRLPDRHDARPGRGLRLARAADHRGERVEVNEVRPRGAEVAVNLEDVVGAGDDRVERRQRGQAGARHDGAEVARGDVVNPASREVFEGGAGDGLGRGGHRAGERVSGRLAVLAAVDRERVDDDLVFQDDARRLNGRRLIEDRVAVDAGERFRRDADRVQEAGGGHDGAAEVRAGREARADEGTRAEGGAEDLDFLDTGGAAIKIVAEDNRSSPYALFTTASGRDASLNF